MRTFQSRWPRRIDRLAIGPAGHVAAACENPGGLEVFDPASGRVTLSREPNSGRRGMGDDRRINTLAFGPGGRLYFSRGTQGLTTADPATGRPAPGPEPELPYPELAVSADNRRLLVASWMNEVGAVSGWEVEADGTARRRWREGPYEFTWFHAPALSADGTLAAVVEAEPDERTAAEPPTVAIRDAARGWELRRFDADADQLVFTPDGRLLERTRRAGVRVWDVGAGEVVGTIRHPDRLRFAAVAAHPGGGLLATADGGGAVRFWDARTLREVRAFDWQVGKVWSVAFAPDGLTCAAGGSKGQVVVWDVDG